MRRKLRVQQRGNVGGASGEPHGDQGEQHQDGAGQGVEEELDRRVNAPRAAPHADDQVHRDQHAFKEHVEHDEIRRAEHADHHGFQDQEAHHELPDADVDGLPGRQDADRGQQGGEQDEEHGNAVHAHAVADLEVGQPVDAFVELEARIGRVEIDPQHKREGQHQQTGPKRGPAGVGGDGCFVPADHHHHRAADQRQPGDQRQDWETGDVGHH